MSRLNPLERMARERELMRQNPLYLSASFDSLMMAATMNAVKSPDSWSGSVSFDAGGERPAAYGPVCAADVGGKGRQSGGRSEGAGYAVWGQGLGNLGVVDR